MSTTLDSAKTGSGNPPELWVLDQNSLPITTAAETQHSELDDRWFEFLAMLCRWKEDPSLIPRDEEDDPPVTDAVRHAALAIAKMMYLQHMPAPSGIGADCDGAIVFELHMINPQNKAIWTLQSMSIQADLTIYLKTANSDGYFHADTFQFGTVRP